MNGCSPTSAQRFRQLDILVTNVAYTKNESILHCDLDPWEQTINTVRRSDSLCTRPAAQIMTTNGGGSIVNNHGFSPFRGGSSPTWWPKGGGNHLTQRAALDLAPFNIRVKAVGSGMVGTRVGSGEFGNRSYENPRISAGHIGAPEDVLDAFAFLVSNRAKYILGVILPVDGGPNLGLWTGHRRPDSSATNYNMPMQFRRLVRVAAYLAAIWLFTTGLIAAAQSTDRRGRKYKAPPPTAKVEVTVLRDTDAKPIENAAVIFHPVVHGRDGGNMELKSNEDGKAVIDVLPIGDTVRLQIIAKGFQTYGGDYKIDKDQIALEIRMKRPGEQYSIYKPHPENDKDKRDQKPDDKKDTDKPAPDSKPN